MRDYFRLALLLSACCLMRAVVAEDKPDVVRLYKDGPLRISEFQGKPDYSLNGDAYTACSCEYQYKYDVEKNAEKYTATLTTFTALSTFLPHKSWWKQRADPDLIDHEQGHFDIAQIIAQRIQLAFDRSFKTKQKVSGTGPTSQDAVNELTRKLNKVMKVANQQLQRDNADYDSTTRHGMRFRSQAEQRRVQQATLQRLSKQIADVQKKRALSPTDSLR